MALLLNPVLVWPRQKLFLLMKLRPKKRDISLGLVGDTVALVSRSIQEQCRHQADGLLSVSLRLENIQTAQGPGSPGLRLLPEHVINSALLHSQNVLVWMTNYSHPTFTSSHGTLYFLLMAYRIVLIKSMFILKSFFLTR